MRPLIFVFGSNLDGHHGGGAALHAMNAWGAKWGVGEGRTGNSYALPTKRTVYQSLTLPEVEDSVQRFLQYARENPDLEFYVTRVGCGLAGFTDEQIAPFFADAPENCRLPMGWRTEDRTEESASAP